MEERKHLICLLTMHPVNSRRMEYFVVAVKVKDESHIRRIRNCFREDNIASFFEDLINEEYRLLDERTLIDLKELEGEVNLKLDENLPMAPDLEEFDGEIYPGAENVGFGRTWDEIG